MAPKNCWLCVHHIIFVRISSHVWACSGVKTCPSTMAHNSYWLCVCVFITSYLCPHLPHLFDHAQMWRVSQVLWHLAATNYVCVPHHICAQISPTSAYTQMWRLVQVLWHLVATTVCGTTLYLCLDVWVCSDVKTCPSTMTPISYWLCVHHIISVPTFPPHVYACSDVKTPPRIIAPSSYWLCVRTIS
jgi:hypothetical protein